MTTDFFKTPIRTDVLVSYTNGLYSVPATDAPRYEEFRDMFSSGQLYSKQWLIERLIAVCNNPVSNFPHKPKIAIVGSWFGTLGVLLATELQHESITLVDIDPRCSRFIDTIRSARPTLHPVCADMFKFDYTGFDVVINTSCEHIADITGWVKQLAPNTIIVAQSNNSANEIGHVNPTTSAEHLASLLGITLPLYEGEYKFPMYTRHMVIGRTTWHSQ